MNYHLANPKPVKFIFASIFLLLFVFCSPLDFKEQKIKEIADVMTEIDHSFILENASSIRSIPISATPSQLFISHRVYS